MLGKPNLIINRVKKLLLEKVYAIQKIYDDECARLEKDLEDECVRLEAKCDQEKSDLADRMVTSITSKIL